MTAAADDVAGELDSTAGWWRVQRGDLRLTRVRGVPCAGAAVGFGELSGIILPARLSLFLTVVSGFLPASRAVARVYHKAVPL